MERASNENYMQFVFQLGTLWVILCVMLAFWFQTEEKLDKIYALTQQRELSVR
jgi:hypothetical protein